VIPNWADGALLRPEVRGANPLRAEWGLGDKFVVGYSGNLGRVHEFRTVLDAAEALRSQADIVFLFIGDGAQKAALATAAQERGLSNILFRPYQPREALGQSLGAADVHLVTLRPELEGLVVPSKFYGVAAVGRPTIFIGDPEGEIGSVVREARCGMCVQQGDGEGLAQAITTLRDDSALRERMGANARRVFEERYDRAIAVEEWRRLLHDVAAAK
jgi:glycosyltransferase involved in cell wall biosynthesis